MSEKTMAVKHQDKHYKVIFNDFNTLKSKVEKKFSVSLSNHELEYFDSLHDRWIGICDDDDLKGIAEQSEGRIKSKDSGSTSKGMAEHGNQNLGNQSIVGHGNTQNITNAEKSVEGDYIARDKITATNMSKVDKFDKTTNIGGKQQSTNNTYSGSITGDQLHFGIGRNVKK